MALGENVVLQKEQEDSDDEDHMTSATAKLDLQVKAFLLIGQAWPLDPSTQGQFLTCAATWRCPCMVHVV